jgi:hypothetical protein
MIFCLALTWASSASADSTTDGMAIDQMMADYGKVKRAALPLVAARQAEAARQLATCKNTGRSWARIKKFKHRTQRTLFIRAGKSLHAEASELLIETQIPFSVYRDNYVQLLQRLDALQTTDPQLQAAIAAHHRRFAYYDSLLQTPASCKVINVMLARAREISARTPQQMIRIDYVIAPIAHRWGVYVSGAIRKAQRVSRIANNDATVLQDAANLLVALGGNAGYANAFRYAITV